MKRNAQILSTITGVFSFMAVLTYVNKFDGLWSTATMFIFSSAIPLSSWLFRKNNFVAFLFTTFFTVIVVRNADQHDWSLIGWVTAATFIPLLLQLGLIIRDGILQYGSRSVALSCVRMFIGFNWLTHCVEKIFVSHIDQGLFNFFKNAVGTRAFGAPLTDEFAVGMIILGGMAEFSSAISLGLGLYSRIGAALSCVYLVMAEILGGHFAVGYTWAIPGGGWEVPFYFFMVTVPFLLPGTGGPISLDNAWRTVRKN